MSEASAAQAYFDPPDEPEYRCEYCNAPVLVNPSDTCPYCLEEEPPELEDYMMRQRGLIE